MKLSKLVYNVKWKYKRNLVRTDRKILLDFVLWAITIFEIMLASQMICFCLHRNKMSLFLILWSKVRLKDAQHPLDTFPYWMGLGFTVVAATTIVTTTQFTRATAHRRTYCAAYTHIRHSNVSNRYCTANEHASIRFYRLNIFKNKGWAICNKISLHSFYHIVYATCIHIHSWLKYHIRCCHKNVDMKSNMEVLHSRFNVTS